MKIKLEDTTRLVGATGWGAIASGAFVALALQVVLSLLGLALALSTGNHTVGGGYAFWTMLVQLFALAVGAALAAHISHPGQQLGGVVAGVMVWATALVLGGLVGRYTMTVPETSTSAWAGFLGAAFGIAAAILGGVLGATGNRHLHLRHRHDTLPMRSTQTGS